MTAVWQTIGVWSAAAFMAVVVFTFLVRSMTLFADSAARTVRRSPLSALAGMLFLAVFVPFAGAKPTPPGPGPTPEPVVTNRVTYVLNEGVNAPGNPTTFTTNDLPITLHSPTRYGYDFMGWLPSDKIPVGTVTDVTYTATWEAVPPPPERHPWPEASNWERIDLDAEHTVIENEDKSRRNAAIPVETEGDVVVPDVLKLHRVVSIGTRAFDSCTRITSVDIPEGVTNIADYAFYNCTSLTNVVFPSTLKSIGAYAFVGCGQLKQVCIEAPRLTIGDRAFRNCDGLQTIQFVGDELIASTHAFFGCGGLRDVNLIVKDITLSEGVFSGGYDPYSSHYGYCDHLTNVLVSASNRVEFGVSVFAGCSALQQLILTAGAEMNVGATAFSGCTALRQATLTAGSAMNVGASAFSSCNYNDSDFRSCTNLINVLMVASNRVELGSSVFSGCTALQAIELPVGLVGVPQNAFAYCSSLQSVSLSSNVTTIAYRAFDTCTSLTNVCMNEGLSVIESQAFYGCALKRLELPQSLSSVGSRAFEKCESLGSVLVREGDTNLYEAAALALGERAFYRCDALTDVRLPQRAAVLPARVFADCACLASINLPSNLTDIAESAFESCEALQYVDFPTNLVSIGTTAFYGCAALDDFSIPTNRIVDLGDKAFVGTKYWNEWLDNSLVTNGVYILGFKGNPTSVELPEGCVAIPAEMFKGMTALTNVTIPASVKKVGLRAFSGSGLLTVELPSVTELGVSAFEGCANLTAVVLAEGLREIPEAAFRRCSSLLAIDIPGSVRSIGAETFRDCVALQDVIGGEGVERVGDYAFAGCVGLQPFRFPKDVAYGEHVFQGVQWTENVLFPSVGTMAMEYPQTYAEIKSVVMSSTLTGIVDRACFGCAALESIVVPDGITRIGTSAFEGCGSLASVVLPASVSNVGSNAFKGCSAISSLTTSGDLVVREVFPEVYTTLKEIKIASGVTSLCDSMLEGCVGLAPGITIPESVEEIGDYAFAGCAGLDIVRYMGPQPTANPNIYFGTKETLVSGVRKKYEESWTVTSSSNTTSRTLPVRWPLPTNNVSSRRIAWWDGPTGGETEGDSITFYYYDATGGKETCGPGLWLEEPPNEREGYDSLGWFTKPYGGVRVESAEECAALGVTSVYAHWVRNRDDHDDPQEWGDVLYDANKTHVYDGYLLDGDQVAGTIRLSLAKGKYDRKEETTSVKLTAKILILGEGKTLSLKGNAEDVGEDGGCGILAKGDREAEIEFSPNEMSGSFEGLDIVGSRNMFGEKTDWDKRTARAALDDCTDSCSVVLQADGDSPFACGYVALSVTFSSKGKAKIVGTMPDGTKVSISSQLLVFEDRCVLPVVAPLYSGKKGGFGFSIIYPKDEGADAINPYVAELTSWVANPGKTLEFVSDLTEIGIGRTGNVASSSVFSVDDSFDVDGAVVDDALLPSSVEVTVSGTKWKMPKADKVKFDRESKSYDVTPDYGNPAGLKLTYAAKTGTFKGSFKVYAVTDAGKSKKYTATVNGAVLDGTGYGTAVIKKVGAVPVVIE